MAPSPPPPRTAYSQKIAVIGHAVAHLHVHLVRERELMLMRAVLWCWLQGCGASQHQRAALSGNCTPAGGGGRHGEAAAHLIKYLRNCIPA